MFFTRRPPYAPRSETDARVAGNAEILVYTDGAARGNPGPAAAGYAIFDSGGNLLEKGAKTLGRHTNNEAEYGALVLGLERASQITRGPVKFHSDSELMVYQVNGVYQVKKEHLRAYVDRAKAGASRFERFKLVYVPRENPGIQLVDGLVNDALDREGF